MIYLDCNATTPLDAAARRAMMDAMDAFGNPSSLHAAGRRAKRIMESARLAVASLAGCSAEEVVFTPGGTESNNIALIGYASRFGTGHIISSAIEHPAVLRPLEHLRRHGFDVTLLPVSSRGMVDPADISRAARKDTILVSIMHANNETGVIQPISEIAAITREREIVLHSDAAQTPGKTAMNVEEMGVDMLSLAAHKFYGPKGIGALYIRKGLEINPVIFGASQERGISPGTENTVGIAGMGAAARIAKRGITAASERMRRLRDLLLAGLMERLEGITVNGDLDSALPNTLNISIPGITANEMVYRLRNRLAFSAGSACHAGRHSPSHVLTAMGLDVTRAASSIRLSLGRFTTKDEIARAVDLLASTAARMLRT